MFLFISKKFNLFLHNILFVMSLFLFGIIYTADVYYEWQADYNSLRFVMSYIFISITIVYILLFDLRTYLIASHVYKDVFDSVFIDNFTNGEKLMELALEQTIRTVPNNSKENFVSRRTFRGNLIDNAYQIRKDFTKQLNSILGYN